MKWLAGRRKYIWAGSLGLLMLLLIWLPAHHAKNVISAKPKYYSNASSSIQKQINSVNWMLPISAVQLRQPGTIQKYVKQMQNIAKQLNGQKIPAITAGEKVRSMPLELNSQLVNLVNSQIVLDSGATAGINSALQSDTKRAVSLADYNAQVAKALTNLFEYIPSDDMSFFDLKSEDTQKRLDLARKGLDKTIGNLQALTRQYDDPGLAEVIATISDIQKARGQLAIDGDKVGWISGVTAAQLTIQKNRKAFLDEAKQGIITALSNDQNRVLTLVNQWRQLAKEHGIKA